MNRNSAARKRARARARAKAQEAARKKRAAASPGSPEKSQTLAVPGQRANGRSPSPNALSLSPALRPTRGPSPPAPVSPLLLPQAEPAADPSPEDANNRPTPAKNEMDELDTERTEEERERLKNVTFSNIQKVEGGGFVTRVKPLRIKTLTAKRFPRYGEKVNNKAPYDPETADLSREALDSFASPRFPRPAPPQFSTTSDPRARSRHIGPKRGRRGPSRRIRSRSPPRARKDFEKGTLQSPALRPETAPEAEPADLSADPVVEKSPGPPATEPKASKPSGGPLDRTGPPPNFVYKRLGPDDPTGDLDDRKFESGRISRNRERHAPPGGAVHPLRPAVAPLRPTGRTPVAVLQQGKGFAAPWDPGIGKRALPPDRTPPDPVKTGPDEDSPRKLKISRTGSPTATPSNPPNQKRPPPSQSKSPLKGRPKHHDRKNAARESVTLSSDRFGIPPRKRPPDNHSTKKRLSRGDQVLPTSHSPAQHERASSLRGLAGHGAPGGKSRHPRAAILRRSDIEARFGSTPLNTAAVGPARHSAQSPSKSAERKRGGPPDRTKRGGPPDRSKRVAQPEHSQRPRKGSPTSNPHQKKPSSGEGGSGDGRYGLLRRLNTRQHKSNPLDAMPQLQKGPNRRGAKRRTLSVPPLRETTVHTYQGYAMVDGLGLAHGSEVVPNRVQPLVPTFSLLRPSHFRALQPRANPKVQIRRKSAPSGTLSRAASDPTVKSLSRAASDPTLRQLREGRSRADPDVSAGGAGLPPGQSGSPPPPPLPVSPRGERLESKKRHDALTRGSVVIDSVTLDRVEDPSELKPGDHSSLRPRRSQIRQLRRAQRLAAQKGDPALASGSRKTTDFSGGSSSSLGVSAERPVPEGGPQQAGLKEARNRLAEARVRLQNVRRRLSNGRNQHRAASAALAKTNAAAGITRADASASTTSGGQSRTKRRGHPPGNTVY